MTSQIVKVRENIKPAYTSQFGTLAIHGISFADDPAEFEYHSKSDKCKLKVGETISYIVTTDKKGNAKIKLEQAPPSTSAASPAPQHRPTSVPQNIAPGAHPEQIVAVGRSATWLAVFSAICTLKSGTATKLDDVIAATDTTYLKVSQ